MTEMQKVMEDLGLLPEQKQAERQPDPLAPTKQQDRLAAMQAAAEQAIAEDCAKLPSIWVNNFRLLYTDNVVKLVFSESQDPSGRVLPKARVALAMPLLMLEQLVEGIGPQYLQRIREAMKLPAQPVAKQG